LKMKVYLTTLGCKLNESELEAWTRQFAARGDEIVNDAREADLCVVNTCTVTQAAARKSRLLAKKVAHANQNAQIVVTGCYATLAPEEARALPNVAFVVPNPDKDQLVALAGERFSDARFQMVESGCRMPEAASGELASSCHFERSEWHSPRAVPSGKSPAEPRRDFSSQTTLLAMTKEAMPHPRTRAFVKIEDGCNMSCAYCIIPLARGRARSRTQADIVDQVAQLVDDGYREVILTGVQISDYHLEEREAGRGRLRGLCSLVRDILERTALPRLRLTSIAPWDLDEELLDLFSDARLCRHLHLSLQCGSTTVLRRMRRPYSADQFAQAVELARAKVPDVGITTDVIVGFPGESDVEFQESLEFVERMGFARVHVFPYSARAGTTAAQFPLQVPAHIKDARAKAMQSVADESGKRFARRFLGRTLPVLYETETPSLTHEYARPDDAQGSVFMRHQPSPVNNGGGQGRGFWSGYTDNYIRVVTRSGESLANRIVPTKLEEVIEDGARGNVVSGY
jgi:threonylcarbamoyladenosine tRNA methylthiotransferase MtaB